MHYLSHKTLGEKLPELEARLGVTFTDQDLLAKACVHTSYVNEHRDDGLASNERLEFLGDAVLELVTTDALYKQYPSNEEGELTAFRSALVKGENLAAVARDLGLGEFLLLSHGEEKSGGREKNYLLANMFESLIGALYLDRGYEVTREFIDRHILEHIGEIVEKGLYVDAKSHLQELTQEEKGLTPSYAVITEEGPDHNKVFTVGVYVGEELLAEGTGSSKQKAEQSAATNALQKRG
ncbi:ribonuclease III [Candidatus Peregrinibacteria bacterium CG_4_9_14_0_2_um_filter_53_11]|nr:MAG: ribonuclease III [Candidatus Peregrinibacteria bacterium CG_4_9_14_0_2_um_filter_53_11]